MQKMYQSASMRVIAMPTDIIATSANATVHEGTTTQQYSGRRSIWD